MEAKPITKVYAAFGVYGRPSDDERDVLDLANEFRLELATLLHERHRATLDYREAKFPTLWAAMVRYEQLYAAIFLVEKEIKAYHSKVRDRNAVTDELGSKLTALRSERDAAGKRLKIERKAWSDHLKAFGVYWKGAADWKQFKNLELRQAAYAALVAPAEFSDYLQLHLDFDLREREIYRDFQAEGLHSAIRAEIVESTQPKMTATGPGIRYRYSRPPRLRPWRRLTLQFSGGVTWGELLRGSSNLHARLIYTNHPADGDESVVEMKQQIGTKAIPRWIVYRLKLDKPLEDATRIQRWTLLIDGDKRYALPLVAGVAAKPSGQGSFSYTLRWTSRPEGVLVSEFCGEHVREQLILPRWLVEKRMAVTEAQVIADNTANDILEEVGISRSKEPGALHGVSALEAWCADNPTVTWAANELDRLRDILRKAAQVSESALRCIEDIYLSSAAKVCRLHDSVQHPTIDLSKTKRYDTRDLLEPDVLPEKSREILHAVAPGKLREAIKMYGLTSVEELPEFPAVSDTDRFTTYVRSLGRKTGTQPAQPCRRSRHDD